MELDEFIKSVIVKVLSGIRQAQDEEKVGAFVVPGKEGGHEYPKNARVSSSARLKSTIIDFDVAITVESSDKTAGGGGLKIAGIGADIKGESATKDTRVSRIQFGVPILLPENQRNWYEEITKKEGA
ncbi:hypothetical protein [Nitrosomonas communis]|uniref:Uncharacterized protein n=1 Tax=Nitrosomonas communis TaxID=44574 RepID=A0A1I4RJI3_9PROT|nr:hypothetical protein [Nitrosomonas communis]SFM52462.1 hypothetical protein SAMN05421863_103330 [Nitrosomonas communis]